MALPAAFGADGHNESPCAWPGAPRGPSVAERAGASAAASALQPLEVG
jgi:hypothetical protein